MQTAHHAPRGRLGPQVAERARPLANAHQSTATTGKVWPHHSLTDSDTDPTKISRAGTAHVRCARVRVVADCRGHKQGGRRRVAWPRRFGRRYAGLRDLSAVVVNRLFGQTVICLATLAIHRCCSTDVQPHGHAQGRVAMAPGTRQPSNLPHPTHDPLECKRVVAHLGCSNRSEAERGGFEPPKRLPVYSISSAAPSATRTPLRERAEV